MEFRNLTNRNFAVVLLLILGIILAISPAGTIRQTNLSADEMAQKVKSKSNQIAAEEVAHILIDKQPGVTLIDLRSQTEYNQYHLPTAIHLPLEDLFKPAALDTIDPENTLIIYSNGDAHAAQAWLLMQQQGYDAFILTGGMNYWAQAIINPQKPDDLVADSEILRYHFRQSAAKFFTKGGVAEDTQPAAQKPAVLKILKFKKKKKSDEGC